MTNSEFQKRLYSAIQQLNFNDEYKFINKLKNGGQIKDSGIKNKGKDKFTVNSRKCRMHFIGGSLKDEEKPIEETQTWRPTIYNNSYNYVISLPYQEKIRNWEGEQMKYNDSFENQSITALKCINKESLQRLSPAQLDSLISYRYHVPKKYFHTIVPIVNQLKNAQNQEQFNQIITQIYKAMPATNNPLRGTVKRIKVEQLPFVVSTAVQKPADVEPEPQPTISSILSKQMRPIVEVPDATLVARPAPSIKLAE